MIFKTIEEKVGDDYFADLNQNLGWPAILAFSSFLFMSQSNQALSQALALLISVTLIYLVWQKGGSYRKIKESYLKGYPGPIGWFRLIRKMALFILSFTLIWLLAIGEINAQIIMQAIKA